MPGCPEIAAQPAGNEQTPGMQMGQTGLMSMQGMEPQTLRRVCRWAKPDS